MATAGTLIPSPSQLRTQVYHVHFNHKHLLCLPLLHIHDIITPKTKLGWESILASARYKPWLKKHRLIQTQQQHRNPTVPGRLLRQLIRLRFLTPRRLCIPVVLSDRCPVHALGIESILKPSSSLRNLSPARPSSRIPMSRRRVIG
jgi:hypothetical protein